MLDVSRSRAVAAALQPEITLAIYANRRLRQHYVRTKQNNAREHKCVVPYSIAPIPISSERLVFNAQPTFPHGILENPDLTPCRCHRFVQNQSIIWVALYWWGMCSSWLP